MRSRTREYLETRFREHYETVDVERPPDAQAREWAWIPWRDGAGMVRHRSLFDVGSLPSFLARERPRHVYASAAVYDDPGARDMGAKGYLGADLVFDLDADHLPEVDADEMGYGEQLEACRDRLLALLDLLEDDFGFTEYDVSFSGRRGYHVRSERVRDLDADARREVVEHVRGAGVDFDAVVDTEAIAAPAGRRTAAQKRRLDSTGGWSRRVHRRLVSVVDDVESLAEPEAKARLQSYDGIGAGRADALYRTMTGKGQRVRDGNVDVHSAMKPLLEALTEETVRKDAAPIDEPVTTDTRRLMRVPGTLHGGSGLVVRALEGRDAVGSFDPLVDAVPETFRGDDVAVEVPEGPVDVPADGGPVTVEAGTHSFPEHVAVHLLARGVAEKAET